MSVFLKELSSNSDKRTGKNVALAGKNLKKGIYLLFCRLQTVSMNPDQTFLRRLLPTIFALLLSSVGFSQFALPEKIPADPAVRIGRLPNGLTYYIRENRVFRNVQLRLVVNAGSILEEEDQQGLAHFVEHMNFNGLKHFPRNELVNYLQSLGLKIGADLNAFTGYDATNYQLWMTTGDDKKLDKGFTILEDWSHNALLDTVEINKERNVVLEESRLHKTANERMEHQYLPVLLNGSPYARRIPIGKDSIIANFRPESLRRYYETWYRPDLEAIVVVGDIDAAFVEKEIIKHFSSYSNPVNERPRPANIPITQRNKNEGFVAADKEFQSTVLDLYTSMEKRPAIVTWADYRETIVEQLFNHLIEERLSGMVQQANPPFLSGKASFGKFYGGYQAFNSYIVIGDKPLQPALDSLIVTLGAVRKYGFLETELSRAKSVLLHKEESAFADVDKTGAGPYADVYAGNYLTGAPIIAAADRYHFIAQVLPTITAEEINALGKKLDLSQSCMTLLRTSEERKAALPSGEQLVDQVTRAQQLPVYAYREKAVGHSLMDHLPDGGKIVRETHDKNLGTTDLELSNGVTVTLKPTSFKNDDIQMDSWRWGGFHNYGINEKPNAMNAARIVQAMGIEGFTNTDLDKFLAGKTVHVQPYINPYEEGVEGNCSPGDLETFFQLIYLYNTRPAKDVALFESYLDKQKGMFQNVKTNPMNYYTDTLIKIEYRNSPWANSIPVPSEFEHISLDKVMEIYRTIFGNAYGQHYTFVGSFDVETMKPLLERYLGGLPSSRKDNLFTDEGMRPAKGIVEASITKGTARKGQVNIIFDGEGPYARQDILKLDLLVEVLNIRIYQQLREEMGGTYNPSLSATFSKRPYEHYSVTAKIPCAPENADRLTKALFDILNDARENGVDKNYVSKIKEMMMNHHSGQMKVNDYWLASLSHSWIDQEDPVWMTDYYKMVNDISARELKETAKKYLDTNNYIKVVLKPE
jgi:zinc protease